MDSGHDDKRADREAKQKQKIEAEKKDLRKQLIMFVVLSFAVSAACYGILSVQAPQ